MLSLSPVNGDDQQPSLQARTQAFLQDFFAKGQQFVRELIEENDRLRSQDAAYSALRSTPASLMMKLKQQIEHLEAECVEIRRLAGSVTQQSGSYRAQLDALEAEHHQLAAMHVTARQFHGATTIEEVIRTVTEVLLNFLGIGLFTIYLVDEERQILFPFHREGGDVEDRVEVKLPAEGALAEVLGAQRPWRASGPRGSSSDVILQLPLVSGTRLVGLIRIEGFLPQKLALEDGDLALLEIVSEHSGISIESAWIRAHAEEVPFARRLLEEFVVG